MDHAQDLEATNSMEIDEGLMTWKCAALVFLGALFVADRQLAAFMLVTLLLIYFAVEFGWGGGNPNHKDHNRPPGNL